MSVEIGRLLIHSDYVPAEARAALAAAYREPRGEERRELLQSAGRLVYHSTDAECVDVKELFDLGGGDCECG